MIEASLLRLEPSDEHLAQAVDRGAQLRKVGAFGALLAPAGEGSWLGDEAFPMKALRSDDQTLEELRLLRSLFAERAARPVMEFNEPLWPRLPRLLERDGWRDERREPIMLCVSEGLRPRRQEDVLVSFLNAASPDADFAHYLEIFTEVFRGRPSVSEEEVGALRREASAGRNHALATVGGVAAGIGYASSSRGVCEITRMATRPAFRRRGVAASTATFMLEDRFGSGDELAWLTASDIAAQALYTTLGFIASGAHCRYTWMPPYARHDDASG
jgi:GNAT superfamily N-acetyltransferase